MSLSLKPFVVDVNELNEVIERSKKDYSLFSSNIWSEVNKYIKTLGIKDITGKMIYEDIITQNFRFTSFEQLPIYTSALKSMLSVSMQNSEYLFCREIRYKKLIAEGKKPNEIQFSLDEPTKKIWYKFNKEGSYNLNWTPCDSEIMNHLPCKTPINIPLCDDYFISTVLNKEINYFLKNLNLSNCTDKDGEKEFKDWFELALDRNVDVVMIIG